ncbi:ArsR family transcriptional regulator [Pelovirga terrestris]|uniref:ArsR family transcriptional regulator n=1 Tax=Pelovirga terrestris TaxID=2771352 RepID=A0A8J6UL27_9BACT|nr:ArsR family transcriptional regulator [Pelovirga terrestris]MBD1400457.1 ArsR family transcriptional regulator [Pelovirga terrestris]MBW6510107.1 ArsR family transcriptional regulator [Desulfuromonadales bacterium]
MLEALLGTVNKERVLLYLFAREEGYPREVAKFYGADLRSIQNQFENLEVGRVLYSRLVGNTRLYAFNPRYPFLEELKALLDKALSFYSDSEREQLVMVRKRPRRKGKPL